MSFRTDGRETRLSTKISQIGLASFHRWNSLSTRSRNAINLCTWILLRYIIKISQKVPLDTIRGNMPWNHEELDGFLSEQMYKNRLINECISLLEGYFIVKYSIMYKILFWLSPLSMIIYDRSLGIITYWILAAKC